MSPQDGQNLILRQNKVPAVILPASWSRPVRVVDQLSTGVGVLKEVATSLTKQCNQHDSVHMDQMRIAVQLTHSLVQVRDLMSSMNLTVHPDQLTLNRETANRVVNESRVIFEQASQLISSLTGKTPRGGRSDGLRLIILTTVKKAIRGPVTYSPPEPRPDNSEAAALAVIEAIDAVSRAIHRASLHS